MREERGCSTTTCYCQLSLYIVLQVAVDGCGDPEASAEAATLTDYTYDDFKSVKKDVLEVLPYELSDSALTQWNRGTTLARAQNLARW